MVTSTTLATPVQTWHDGGMFVGMHWLWWLFWVFTLVLIAWALVRLGAGTAGHRDALGREAAEETLRRRFAAGEIDEEEYRRRMSILRETAEGG